MAVNEPNLKQLLDWSRQASSGRPCAAWLAWRRSSPMAARRAQQLIAIADRLDRGDAPLAATALGATDVAQYVEGRLSPLAAEQIEAACWNSPEQMCEVASALEFSGAAGEIDEVPIHLTDRLLAIAPRAIERRRRRAMQLPYSGAAAANGQSVKPRVAPPAISSSNLTYTLEPAAPAIRRPTTAMSRRTPAEFRMLLAAAAVVLMLAGGAIGWWISNRLSGARRLPTANDRPAAPPTPRRIPGESKSHIVKPLPKAPSDRAPRDTVEPPPASQLVEIAPPQSPVRQHAVPIPSLGARHTATVDTPIGAVLADADHSGRLRVASGEYSLAEPLRLVSLAESWSRVEITDVGSLVLAGPAELTLASWGDGVLEIDLRYGRVGFERLPAGQAIRFHAGSEQWLMRGASNYASLAVFHDPGSPSLVVPSGKVAVENVELSTGQFVRFAGGTLQPPQPLAAGPAAASDGLATNWLAAPDDERQRKWREQYGKLSDRLAIVDDAGAELPLIFASVRDTRQAALLAEWSVAAVEESARPAQLWAVVGDRRELVRLAGVRTLLAIRPGDERLVHFVRHARAEWGDDVGGRIAQWMRGKDQPGQIALPQAVELAEYLGHRELALRQLAVSLLERHAAPALARVRRAPPAYDAAEAAGKRAESQQQWRLLIRQIFAPQRTAPAALGAQRPPQLAPAAANGNQP